MIVLELPPLLAPPFVGSSHLVHIKGGAVGSFGAGTGGSVGSFGAGTGGIVGS